MGQRRRNSPNPIQVTSSLQLTTFTHPPSCFHPSKNPTTRPHNDIPLPPLKPTAPRPNQYPSPQPPPPPKSPLHTPHPANPPPSKKQSTSPPSPYNNYPKSKPSSRKNCNISPPPSSSSRPHKPNSETAGLAYGMGLEGKGEAGAGAGGKVCSHPAITRGWGRELWVQHISIPTHHPFPHLPFTFTPPLQKEITLTPRARVNRHTPPRPPNPLPLRPRRARLHSYRPRGHRHWVLRREEHGCGAEIL